MQNSTILAACAIVLLAGGCDKLTGKRKKAVKDLSRTPCERITATANRCEKVIGDLVKKRQLADSGRSSGAVARRGSRLIRTITRIEWCPGRVKAAIRYQRKDCSKYIGSHVPKAVEICEKVKRRQVRSLRLLKQCFTLADCAKVAACFVDKYAVNRF